MSSLDLIAISVGNTRTHVGLFRNDELERAADIEGTDRAKIVRVPSAGLSVERVIAPFGIEHRTL